MKDVKEERDERLSYQKPEIRSLGTIAEITAGGWGGWGRDPWNPGGHGGS